MSKEAIRRSVPEKKKSRHSQSMVHDPDQGWAIISAGCLLTSFGKLRLEGQKGIPAP